MLRKLACAVVVFLLCLSVSLAEDKAQKKKKTGKAVQGTVKKVDATAGTITVSVKQKKELVDKVFAVESTTKVTVLAGDAKKELIGKEVLKSDQLKEGTKIAITTDEAGKVSAIRVGVAAKKKKAQGKAAQGTVKKVNPATGTLTVSVKQKKEFVDKDFTVDSATKIIVFTENAKQQLAGKEGLKSDQIKEGAKVAIRTDEAGKVLAIQVGAKAKKKKENK